jgi:hypothetical protein
MQRKCCSAKLLNIFQAELCTIAYLISNRYELKESAYGLFLINCASIWGLAPHYLWGKEKSASRIPASCHILRKQTSRAKLEAMLYSSYLGLVSFLKGHYKASENEPRGFASKGDHHREKKADVS